MALISLEHLLRATTYSMHGLGRAWKKEQAFRHEVLLLVVMVPLLLWLAPGLVWTCLLLCAWLAVMAVELLNSALEEAFDLISPEYNEHVKHGKDMASAAVFALLIMNGILWIGMLVSL